MKNRSPAQEGLICVALTVILLMTTLSVPLVELLSILLLPISMILLCIRHNLKTGVFAVLVTSIVTAIFVAPQIGFHYLCIEGSISIIWGAAIRARLSTLKILLLGVTGQVLGVLLILFAAAVNHGKDIISFTGQLIVSGRNQTMESYQQFMEFYRQIGFSEDLLTNMQQAGEQNIELTIKIIPAIIIIGGFIETFLIYKLLIKISRKSGDEVAALVPIKEWDVSVAGIHVFLWSLVMIYLGNTNNIAWLQIIGYNLCLIMSVILFLQGMAVFYFLADKYSLSKLIRGIILIVVFIYIFHAIIIMGTVGLFDIIFNYRRIERGNH